MAALTQAVGSGTGQSVFGRYTEAMRRAIFCARLEAEDRAETVITVMDLLAGLSAEEDTRAERVAALKSNAFYLRWLAGLPALPARHPERAEEIHHNQLELDSDVKRAFLFARMEADRDGEYWIDSDHLLRGLMRFPNRAQFAMLKTEISLSVLRAASREDRVRQPSPSAPDRKWVRFLLHKYSNMLAPVLSLACYLYILIQGYGMTLSPLAK